MPTKKTTKKKPKVEATLIAMGKKFKGTGETVTDAVKSIDLKYPKTKGILTIKKGNKTTEKIIPATLLNRALSLHGISGDVAMKQLKSLFE